LEGFAPVRFRVAFLDAPVFVVALRAGGIFAAFFGSFARR
jgi:hypothetical protein